MRGHKGPLTCCFNGLVGQVPVEPRSGHFRSSACHASGRVDLHLHRDYDSRMHPCPNPRRNIGLHLSARHRGSADSRRVVHRYRNCRCGNRGLRRHNCRRRRRLSRLQPGNIQRVAGGPLAFVIHQKPEQDVVIGSHVVKLAAVKLGRRQGNLILQGPVRHVDHALRGLLDSRSRGIPTQLHVSRGSSCLHSQWSPARLVFEHPQLITDRSGNDGQNAPQQQRQRVRSSNCGRRLVIVQPDTARDVRWQRSEHGPGRFGRFGRLRAQRSGRRHLGWLRFVQGLDLQLRGLE